MDMSAEIREIAVSVDSSGIADMPAVSLFIDDLSIVGEPLQMERNVNDDRQVDLLHNSGDQTFGLLSNLDDGGAELKTATGATIRIGWPDIRSLRFPRSEFPMENWKGQIAVLSFPTGERLLGSLDAAAGSHLKFKHPFLGDVDLPESQARSIEIRPADRRQEVTHVVRHLGAKYVALFREQRPSATTLRATVKLDRPPTADAVVSLWVAGMEGVGTNARFVEKLKQGHLQSVLIVNDRKVKVLNELLADQTREFKELRVPLPADCLRVGENVFEIRQSEDPATGNFDECEVADMSLEYKSP